ncbi:aminotransferase class III-fold pyridoxal phosphate-dependent enzyme [Pseudomonadales bacterium]|nr:aminotransferase class III-fold pyridoxal phosphate-dependent enzyme [Pseudomonadales bacterium]
MNSYKNSVEFLDRAEKVIPLGSQTFSKSRTQYPVGVSPLFIDRGEGSKVWDIDGNQYVDFVNSLLAVSIGYNHPSVDAAVIKQLKKGVSFSLPSKLEYEVASLLVDMVPCAEMVRFGKNGSDATSAAIRLARAYTQKDYIAVCGYHGWHDWYIGTTTKNLGVPVATSDLSISFPYNDIDALERLLCSHKNKFAAIIMEPINAVYPLPGYLEAVRDLATKHKTVLIFDEICTGARLSPGGAQELFGVTPDLCAMGKGLANGHPLSAVMGKREIMELCSEIFFSGTFGGENLSLAAAKEVLSLVKTGAITKKLEQTGSEIMEGVREIVADNGLGRIFSFSGHPSWSFINITRETADDTMVLKTLFLQEMFKRGVLILSSHNISYAHTSSDVTKLLAAYSETMDVIKDSVKNNCVRSSLACDPLKLLFKVR